MITKSLAFGLISASLLFGSAANANYSVTVGNANDGNCYPFVCAASDGITLYQQIYNQDNFSNSAYILSFNYNLFTEFGYGSDLMDSATYTIGFSTLPDYILSTDPTANIGPDYKEFGVFSLSGYSPEILSFKGSPFFYDPSQGNLLMTVQISDLLSPGAYASTYYNSDRFTDNTYRLFGNTMQYALDGGAPVTTFNLTSSLPAPTPLPLLGVGAAYSFSRKYRRRIATIHRNP